MEENSDHPDLPFISSTSSKIHNHMKNPIIDRNNKLIAILFVLISCTTVTTSIKTTRSPILKDQTTRESSNITPLEPSETSTYYDEDDEINSHYIREASTLDFPWDRRLGPVYAEHARDSDAPPSESGDDVSPPSKSQTGGQSPVVVPPSLRNWIPVPWIKLLSEASFRRRNPPPQEFLMPPPAAKPKTNENYISPLELPNSSSIPNPHDASNNMIQLPRPPPGPIDHKCTCSPTIRYSSNINHLIPNASTKPPYETSSIVTSSKAMRVNDRSDNNYNDIIRKSIDENLSSSYEDGETYDGEEGDDVNERFLLFSKKSSFRYNGQELTDENMEYVCTQFMANPRSPEKVDWGKRIQRHPPSSANNSSSSLTYDSSTPPSSRQRVPNEGRRRSSKTSERSKQQITLQNNFGTKGGNPVISSSSGVKGSQNSKSNNIKGNGGQQSTKSQLNSPSAAARKLDQFFQRVTSNSDSNNNNQNSQNNNQNRKGGLMPGTSAVAFSMGRNSSSKGSSRIIRRRKVIVRTKSSNNHNSNGNNNSNNGQQNSYNSGVKGWHHHHHEHD